MALLSLRILCGVAAISVGVGYVDGWSLSWTSRVTGFSFIVDGLLVLLGLFTPVAGLIAPILAGAAAFQWLRPLSPWSSEIRLIAVPFAAVCLSLVALGPGAYSMDARIFGRKQVRIPPRMPPDEF